MFCYKKLLGHLEEEGNIEIESRGGLEVEQWSENRTLSISVDQSSLGAYIVGSRGASQLGGIF